MTKRILIATAVVVALLVIALLAPASGTQVAQGAAISVGCVDCKSDCDEAASYCKERAAREMTICRDAGYSFDYCKKVGNKAYTDCMSWRECSLCFDRMNIWYCRCGRPLASTGGGAGSGGENIDPFYNSDPSDPASDDDFSWYCELEPCACGADLPWCG